MPLTLAAPTSFHHSQRWPAMRLAEKLGPAFLRFPGNKYKNLLVFQIGVRRLFQIGKMTLFSNEKPIQFGNRLELLLAE